jgi:hypothetical protein
MMTNLTALSISDPNHWTKEELYNNLQAAVDVELWTIPLYLTALYSIQNLNSNNQANYPVAAKLIESVVIEEMLHLQLASNICNALGYSPQMNFSSYDEADGIPFLKPTVPAKYNGYEVKLGAVDLNQLKLFCVIELPEESTKPDWATQTKYNSIGELYQALEIAITNQWNSLYVGDANNTKQQANFSDYLAKFNAGQGFSQIVSSLETALNAMKAIVGQGEGNSATHEIPAEFQPPAESVNPSDYDPSDYDPGDSHFTKFNEVLDMLINQKETISTYPLIVHPDKDQLAKQANATINLHQSFKTFIHDLQVGFNTAQPNQQLPGSFYSNMFNMQNLITAVWQTGAVPSFPKM